VRLPIGADEIGGEGAFDAGEAENGFGIAGIHGIPEAPEIFERGVTFAVEEGVLEAVGFIAGKAIGDVDHVARLEPARFADHRSERVGDVFPGDPVVPAESAPSDGFVANFELRFESHAVSGGDGSGAEVGGNAFESVEVDAVGADFFQELRERDPGRGGFFAGAGIPGEDGEKNFDVVAVKIVDELFESGEAAGKIAEEIELVAVVHADVGIDVPEEDGVDGAEAALGFGEEFFGRVAAGFGIVDGAVPDEKLDLGKSALGPGEIGIRVVGFIEAELGAAFFAPGLEAGEPGRIGGIGGAGEEDFGRRGRNGESHGAVGSDEGVAGFPFVGMKRNGAGEEED